MCVILYIENNRVHALVDASQGHCTLFFERGNHYEENNFKSQSQVYYSSDFFFHSSIIWYLLAGLLSNENVTD